MAHFAQLDKNNLVIQVVVVDNEKIIDNNGTEQESLGVAFLRSLFGRDTIWLQTSYNGRLRKNYAGIGYSYDPVRDAFISSQPFPSWSLDLETCQWEPPVPRPETDEWVIWVEPEQRWVTAQDIVGIDANTSDSIYHEIQPL
jgi:hypothetical protein